jgi:putative ABC transport system permease protein
VTIDRAFHVLRLRWRSIVRRRAAEQDLADEIAYHLDAEAERRAGRGEDPAAARQAARAAFAVERTKEACRDARGLAFVESVVRDLRVGARALRRQPAYTVPALVTLALGIGVTTALFALVDGILLVRLPYPDADRLISANVTYPAGGIDAARGAIATFDVAAYADGLTFTLAGDGPAMRVSGAKVSAGLFRVLGAGPALGRVFRDGEDAPAQDRVVVLSHGLWVSRFAADPRVVGRAVAIDGIAREVVGVMPAAFDLPSRRTQLWIPVAFDARDTTRYWAGDFMPLVGRLRPGATMAAAEADLRRFQSGVRRLFPWRMPDDWNRDPVVVPLQTALTGDVTPRLLILSIAGCVVLAIACANVANLSLARAATRQREIGIRTAIGGAPRRVARQLITEHLLLSLAGAAGGFALAGPLLAIVTRVLPADTPRLAGVGLDWRAALFTAAVAAIAGAAFGLAPVVHTLRLQLRAVLDSGGRSGDGAATGPIRRALAIGQIACAALLVVAAGLLLRSLSALAGTDPGFRTSGVVTARLTADESRCGDAARCLAFYRELEARMQALPGVAGAAFVNVLPLTGGVAKRSLQLEGYTVPAGRAAPLFRLNVVTPAYGRVMRQRVVAGRDLTEQDRDGAPVALVSAAAARRFWPAQAAVGRHVRFVGEPGWRAVVGVVADVRAHDLTRDEPEWIDGTLYVPHAAEARLEDGRVPSEMIAVIDTTLTSAALGAQLQRLAAEHGGLVVDAVRDIEAVVAEASATPAATTTVLVATAGLALVLGSVGVYAVLSFLVARRMSELGVRVALGALPRDVRWLVLGEGARLCAAGLALGLGGALIAMRGLAHELHGVSPRDPLTYGAVVATIASVSLIACLVPARRAMRVNPLSVLRGS